MPWDNCWTKGRGGQRLDVSQHWTRRHGHLARWCWSFRLRTKLGRGGLSKNEGVNRQIERFWCFHLNCGGGDDFLVLLRS